MAKCGQNSEVSVRSLRDLLQDRGDENEARRRADLAAAAGWAKQEAAEAKLRPAAVEK